MDLWVYPSRPKVPSWIWIRCIYSATYRNTFMSPLTFAMSTAMLNSAQTFSYFIPGQPFRRPLCLSPTVNRTIHLWLNIQSCSKISNSIFTLTLAMHIPLRHLAALIFLNSITIFFYPLQQPAQRFPFQQTFIKLLNWKPSIFSFVSFIFLLI